MPEQVLCVLHNLKKLKFLGRWDTYNVVVTNQRFLFARLTGDMLKQAVSEANASGKAEGKGFLDRWGDQMKVSLMYGNRYLTMRPENILQENPDNFSLFHEDLNAVRFNEKLTAVRKGAAVKKISAEVIFDTKNGKKEYGLDGYPTDDIDALKRVIGDKVRA